MKNQKKAYLYGLITVLLWSTVASAFKISLRYLSPIHLLFYSSLVSITVLSLILSAQGRLGLILSYSRKEYLSSLRLGFLNPFLYYLILFNAYDLLPAQVAQPLNYTWALTLAFLSIPMLKQKIHLREIAAGLICYLGVVIISSKGTFMHFASFNLMGVALALASTVVWSLSWIYNTRDSRDPAASLLLAFLFGLPFIFIAALATKGLHSPGLKGLLGALYVGTFEMGITFVFWLKALRLSENTARVGNLIFLSPFLSLIFIHFIVGERIYATTIVGLVLIITGLMVQGVGKDAG
ncbi:MAG TPA: DMT family transporter [Desulfomonilia bacterium]|nr:DMT family transporter [Desulfomonilia bacterium]